MCVGLGFNSRSLNSSNWVCMYLVYTECVCLLDVYVLGMYCMCILGACVLGIYGVVCLLGVYV